MASNDEVILRRIVEGRRGDVAPDISFSDYFELFLSEQALKKYDLSYDELESGIVDGTNDGGIDAVQSFVNGFPVAEDTDFSVFRRNVSLDLYIIQAKASASFSEQPLNAVLSSLADLLDLSRSLSDLAANYNAAVLEAVGRFRNAYIELAEAFPKVRMTYLYGSLGDTQTINRNVVHKAEQLQSMITNLFTDSEFDALFWGARELLKETRRPSINSLQLRVEDALSTEDGGYLCLVKLPNYFAFITDSNGDLRRDIFESNVRDYQGKVEVNAGIKTTLTSGADEDFWWLNNGVTVLATNGSLAGRSLTLEDPQIVNGLQTSTEVYSYFSETLRVVDERSILVRVIVTVDTSGRDKIITATNSQTSLPAASLKAHDQVQRDIEDYLYTHGFYYERRKNFYKNQGRPRDKIISIPYLSQAVVAILHQQPDDARARPSSLLKRERTYEKVFSSQYPIELYRVCAEIMEICNAHVKVEQVDLSQEERNNLRFHIAMYTTALIIGRRDYWVQDIVNVSLKMLTPDFLVTSTTKVVEAFRRYVERNEVTADRAAKSKEFVAELLEGFHTRQQISSE